MEWLKVVGWENLYEVSDTGLVSSDVAMPKGCEL